VVLVDENDREVGLAEKLVAHEKNLLHRAFSIFIFQLENPQKILLQQRALHKYHSGGLWTNTCCSHPRHDEEITKSGQRRLQEELGFSTELTDIGWFHYNAHFENGLAENEVDHVLTGSISSQTIITPDPGEIHAIRWVDIADLKCELAAHPETFTPWIRRALALALSRPK
ncbi:MAG TPA: hypothetical protein DEA62_03905, partial [Coxiellaceae bacterium]|nr:hypothetical protein [Coxiellaceae bacterium]